MDELMQKAIQIAKDNKENFGIEILQKKLKVGYCKCARLIDELESSAIIGCYNQETKRREVLI